MGTKMAVAFANIFMGKVESQILERSAIKPLAWKRYIDQGSRQASLKAKHLDFSILTPPKQYLKLLLKDLKQIS